MDERDEESELLAEVRAHLDWEAAWSGFPVPVMQAPVMQAPVVEAAAFEVPAFVAPSAAPARAPEPRAAAPMPAPAPVAAPSSSLAEALAALPPDDRVGRLRVLENDAARCTRCRLHEGRTKSVFARGSASARIAFVGEGPGYNEDQQGLPFVGAAGQLLDKMIGAMGLGRDDVYVCNVVKCRPPENRTPLPDEAGSCSVYLVPQLEIVQPEVIVALGRCAAENLGVAEAGRSWRGRWGAYRGVPVMPTYHPAYLLRSPEMKKPVWEDLQLVMQRLGLKRAGD